MFANAMFYRYPSSTTYNFIYGRRKRLRLWKILVLVSVLVPDLNLAIISNPGDGNGQRGSWGRVCHTRGRRRYRRLGAHNCIWLWIPVLKTNRQTVVGPVSSHCLRKKEKHSTKWPASNKLLGQHFAKNCKQATAYTSHINYAKLLIQ